MNSNVELEMSQAWSEESITKPYNDLLIETLIFENKKLHENIKKMKIEIAQLSSEIEKMKKKNMNQNNEVNSDPNDFGCTLKRQVGFGAYDEIYEMIEENKLKRELSISDLVEEETEQKEFQDNISDFKSQSSDFQTRYKREDYDENSSEEITFDLEEKKNTKILKPPRNSRYSFIY